VWHVNILIIESHVGSLVRLSLPLCRKFVNGFVAAMPWLICRKRRVNFGPSIPGFCDLISLDSLAKWRHYAKDGRAPRVNDI
jgi:hypothetical protein